MNDKLKIKGIQFLGFCGITKEEKNIGSKFSVDVELFFSLKKAGKTDNLKHTIDYSEVYKTVINSSKKKYNLVECFAENIANEILNKFSCKKVKVLVRKIPPISGIDYIEVEIERVGKRV